MSFHYFDIDNQKLYYLYPDSSENHILNIWKRNPSPISIYGIKGISKNDIESYISDPVLLIKYFCFKIQNLTDISNSNIFINGFHFLYEFSPEIIITQEKLDIIISLIIRHFRNCIVLYFTYGSMNNISIHFFISNCKVFPKGSNYFVGRDYISNGIEMRVDKVNFDINYYLSNNDILKIQDINMNFEDFGNNSSNNSKKYKNNKFRKRKY